MENGEGVKGKGRKENVECRMSFFAMLNIILSVFLIGFVLNFHVKFIRIV